MNVFKNVTVQDDVYFLTKTDYTIDPIPQSMSGDIKVGKGVKLGNPKDPRFKINELVEVSKIDKDLEVKTNDIFKNQKGFNESVDFTKDVPVNAYKHSMTQYIENVTTDELAKALYFNFGASFGFGDFGAAFSHVQSQKNKSHSIVFTRKVEVGATQDNNTIVINKRNNEKLKAIEKMDNTIDRLDVFVGIFGSHYIESITYGYRIAIYANIESTDKNKITEFSAHFKNLSYNASLTASQKAFFSSNKTSFVCNVFSSNSTSDASMTISNLDDIAKFLSGLKGGEVKLGYAPIACKVTSFRPVIAPWDQGKRI